MMEGSAPIVLKSGVTSFKSSRPTTGALHMIPAIPRIRGPTLFNPFTNSFPSPNRFLNTARSRAPNTMKTIMVIVTIFSIWNLLNA